MEILINPPKEIPVTKEEFMNFTYYDLSCFWCNWKAAFCIDDNNNIEVYTHREEFVNRCCRNYRFKDIIWYDIESAEMFTCTIPKGDKLYDFIINNLQHLIMK